MGFRKKEEKKILGVISKLGIKLEVNDGYQPEPEDDIAEIRVKRALKIENYINEEDLFEPEELILDSIIDVKAEYPDDDIIDISEYSQGEPRISRRNIRMIGQMMKEDMDDY